MTNTTCSKFYKGMSREEILEIVKGKNLNNRDIELLISFYANRESARCLSYRYHYAEITIHVKLARIKQRLV